jgi:hypothetical protein
VADVDQGEKQGKTHFHQTQSSNQARHNPVPQERSLTQKSRKVVINETASQKHSTALYQFPPSDSSAKLHTLVTDARFPTQAGFSTSQRSDTV